MGSRIMYVESKAEGLNGRGRIGRVSFWNNGKSLLYDGKTFRRLRGGGYKANYYEVESGDRYWISGPKKNGLDRLYCTPGIYIDEDVQEEYWRTIRNQPSKVGRLTA